MCAFVCVCIYSFKNHPIIKGFNIFGFNECSKVFIFHKMTATYFYSCIQSYKIGNYY